MNMNNFYEPDFPKNLIPLLSYAGLSLKHTNNKLLVYSLKNVIPHWPRYMYLIKKNDYMYFAYKSNFCTFNYSFFEF